MKCFTYARNSGIRGGCTTGEGYLQITVITSSPSISSPGWNLTTISLENTLRFDYEKISMIYLVSENKVTAYLFCSTTFKRNLNLCCLFSITTDFASRVTIPLCIDNSVKLLLELKINGHEAR